MPSIGRGSLSSRKVVTQSLDALCGHSNPFNKLVNFSDKYYLNDLNQAIHEGDIGVICNHINYHRKLNGKSFLSASEYHDLELFCKEYLSQHPPDGVLRMAQFINAVLTNFL